MITNAKPMACGNCGHGLFRFFYTEPTKDEGLLAECAQCKSVSKITFSKPKLVIDWGEGAEGILTTMEPKS